MKPTKEDFLNAVAKNIEHHTDGMTRTEENYRYFSMGPEECAFCQLFNPIGIRPDKCSSCPLYRATKKGCTTEYMEAVSAISSYDYPAFIKAETAIVELLKPMLSSDFYDKYYGKEKEAKMFDIAPYVHRKESLYCYYMGAWDCGLTILIYSIPEKGTDIFKIPNNMVNFFLGYIFDDDITNTFRSKEDIDTIAERFGSYCESLEGNNK